MEPLGIKSAVILGMGPSQGDFRTEIITQDRTEPIADEIWAINLSAMGYRCDRVIWMDDIRAQNEIFPYCIRDLVKLDKPVICPLAVPDLIPKSVTYPVREAYELSIKHFGRAYFNNGVAYAIAYAILGGLKLIKLYGCDFTYPSWAQGESGRACVESWMMAFQMAGGDVHLAPSTSLFDYCIPEGWYGFEPQPIIKTADGPIGFPGWEIRKKEIRLQELIGQGRLAENGPEIESLMKEIGTFKKIEQAYHNELAKRNERRRIETATEMANANFRSVQGSDPGARDPGTEPAREDEPLGKGTSEHAAEAGGRLRPGRAEGCVEERVDRGLRPGGPAPDLGSGSEGPAKARPGNGEATDGMAGFSRYARTDSDDIGGVPA